MIGPSSSAARAANNRPPHQASAPDADPASRAYAPSADPTAHASKPPAAGSSECRPLPKRRRRVAASCKPCRAAKSKCDEDRPCGSCRLRGTEAQCIHEGLESGDAPAVSGIRGPLSELSTIQKSLKAIEVYIRNGGGPAMPSDCSDSPDLFSPPVPGGSFPWLPSISERASRRAGGLYSGPTSIVDPLILSDDEDSDSSQMSKAPAYYDSDLIDAIPSLEVIDSMLEYYFAYGCWIYNLINEAGFRKAWGSYKAGFSTDRLTLATCCLILATTFYLMPERHPTRMFLVHSVDKSQEPGHRFFVVMKEALARHQAENLGYSLELLELTLLSGLYMKVSGQSRGEEAWQVKSQCVTIALAMGLHRDPGKWKVLPGVVDRRRAAWWNVVCIDRWQAYLLGRPITIALHHFDAQLPSFSEPAFPAAGRSYLGNLELLRLSGVIGPILDDAASLQPVPYASIQRNERALLQWLQEMPAELDLSESQLQEGFESDDLPTRRRAVISSTIRGIYYQLRFTLHRPYATLAHASRSEVNSLGDVGRKEINQSTKIATSCAQHVITLASQACVYWPTETVFATEHLSWFSFHLFNAAMFLSLQLVAAPDQPDGMPFRQQVSLAIQTLRQVAALLPPAPGVARKALAVLEPLAPLYEPEFLRQPPAEQAARKTSVFAVVRRLAFPFQDHEMPAQQAARPASRPSTDSPNDTGPAAAPVLPMAAPASSSIPLATHPPPDPPLAGMNAADDGRSTPDSHSIPRDTQAGPSSIERTQFVMPTPAAHPSQRTPYSLPLPSAAIPAPYRAPQPTLSASFTAPGWHPAYDPRENAFMIDPPMAQADMGQPPLPSPVGAGALAAVPAHATSTVVLATWPYAHPSPAPPLAPVSSSSVDDYMGPSPAASKTPETLDPDVQWGALVGMTQGEWARFSQDMQAHPSGSR